MYALIVAIIKPILLVIPIYIIYRMTVFGQGFAKRTLIYVVAYIAGIFGIGIFGSAIVLVAASVSGVQVDVVEILDKFIAESLIWSVFGCIIGLYFSREKQKPNLAREPDNYVE